MAIKSKYDIDLVTDDLVLVLKAEPNKATELTSSLIQITPIEVSIVRGYIGDKDPSVEILMEARHGGEVSKHVVKLGATLYVQALGKEAEFLNKQLFLLTEEAEELRKDRDNLLAVNEDLKDHIATQEKVNAELYRMVKTALQAVVAPEEK